MATVSPARSPPASSRPASRGRAPAKAPPARSMPMRIHMHSTLLKQTLPWTLSRLAFGAALAVAASVSSAQAQPAPVSPAAANGYKAGTTVIQNATILTITHGTIDKGSILIREGKIAAVGPNVSVPQGATVIDATGKYVMPGIIDCHSHIAVDGSVNEGSVSVSSMVGIEDVLNPDDIDIYRALAGGVTVANVLHGSANAIGGKTQVIKL